MILDLHISSRSAIFLRYLSSTFLYSGHQARAFIDHGSEPTRTRPLRWRVPAGQAMAREQELRSTENRRLLGRIRFACTRASVVLYRGLRFRLPRSLSAQTEFCFRIGEQVWLYKATHSCEIHSAHTYGDSQREGVLMEPAPRRPPASWSASRRPPSASSLVGERCRFIHTPSIAC